MSRLPGAAPVLAPALTGAVGRQAGRPRAVARAFPPCSAGPTRRVHPGSEDTGGCRSLIPLGRLPSDQPSGAPGVGPRPLLGSERPPLSLTPRSLWPRPEAQGPSGQRLAVGGWRPARSPMAPLSPSSQFCLATLASLAAVSTWRARVRTGLGVIAGGAGAHRCDVLVHLHSAPVSLARALGPSHSRHGPRV